MRKIIRIFAWMLAVIAVLLAALVFWLRNADLGAYKGQVEQFVSSAIGQEFDIGGRFELHFGPTTTLVAEQVAIRTPGQEGNPELLSLAHFMVAIDTWSLLRRPFVIEQLQVNDAHVYLERDAEGRFNWASERPETGAAETGEFDPNIIAFRTVNIDALEVTYVDAARPRPVVVSLEHLTVNPEAHDILDLDLIGVVNDLPLWADGKVGPWQNLIDGHEVVGDLEVTLGQARLSLRGTIADVAELDGVEVDATLSGPDIARALERLALPPFAEGALEINANVHGYDDGHRLRLDGNIGDIDLFLSGSFDRLLRPDVVSYDFSVAGPNAGRLAALGGITGVPAAPFRVAGDYTRTGSLLQFRNAAVQVGDNSAAFHGDLDLSGPIPDWDLYIDAAGPSIAVAGPFLRMQGLPDEAYTAAGHVSKRNTAWLFESLEVNVGSNRLAIHGQVETGGSGATEIELAASGPDISVLQEFTTLDGLPQRPYDVSVRIRPDPAGFELRDGQARFGDNRLQVAGKVSLDAGMSGTSLAFTASGPDLHNIALLTDVPYLPPGPYDASGTVRVDNGSLVLDTVRAKVTDLEASASGKIAISGNANGAFSLDVSASGPDLGVIPEITQMEQLTGEPFSVAGQLAWDGGRLTATDASATLGNLQVRVDGYLAGQGLANLSVSARSVDSQVLRKLAQLPYLPEGEVRAQGSLEKTETELRFSNASLDIGEFSIAADGALNLSPRRNNSDLEFRVAGPALHELGKVFGNTSLPAKSFSLSGQFHGTPSGFALRDFSATLDDSDLSGEFEADLTGKPGITGRLASRHVDLTDPALLEENDVEATAAAPGDDGRLFSATPFDTSWLQKADVDVDVTIDRLTSNTMDVADVTVGFKLLDGGLTIEPFEFGEGGGRVDARFELVPEGGRYALRAALAVAGIHVGVLVAENQPKTTLPALSGDLSLSGHGNSVRDVMASANGRASFRQDSGKVKEMFGSRLFQDILLQVVRRLNPLRQARDYQLLECGIYEVTIRNGLLTIDDFVIQTDTMTTAATGTVDLASEKLEVSFRAKPREGIGISLGTVANQLLEVRGTLKNPKIRVDAGRTATTTGAAVATGGLSLLARGLWDRMSAEADICKKED